MDYGRFLGLMIGIASVIRRGNFASKQMLKTRIEQFITNFNATMARPFRWTYAGKPLAG